MGLTGTLRRRWYVWSWRWRYWLLDTVHGQKFHIGAFIVSLFVCAVDVAYMLIVALVPPPPGTPQKSIADWIVYLIILIISALIFTMSPLMTRPPHCCTSSAPTVPAPGSGRA